MDYCSHFRPKAFSFAIFDCWGFRGHQFHGRTNHLFKSRRVENDGRMMRAKGGIWMNMIVNIPLHCNHKSQGFKLVKPCAGSHLDPHVEHSTATSYRDLTLFVTPLGSWLLHYEKNGNDWLRNKCALSKHHIFLFVPCPHVYTCFICSLHMQHSMCRAIQYV
jgi:hypothetical protein